MCIPHDKKTTVLFMKIMMMVVVTIMMFHHQVIIIFMGIVIGDSITFYFTQVNQVHHTINALLGDQRSDQHQLRRLRKQRDNLKAAITASWSDFSHEVKARFIDLGFNYSEPDTSGSEAS